MTVVRCDGTGYGECEYCHKHAVYQMWDDETDIKYLIPVCRDHQYKGRQELENRWEAQ